MHITAVVGGLAALSAVASAAPGDHHPIPLPTVGTHTDDDGLVRVPEYQDPWSTAGEDKPSPLPTVGTPTDGDVRLSVFGTGSGAASTNGTYIKPTPTPTDPNAGPWILDLGPWCQFREWPRALPPGCLDRLLAFSKPTPDPHRPGRWLGTTLLDLGPGCRFREWPQDPPGRCVPRFKARGTWDTTAAAAPPATTLSTVRVPGSGEASATLWDEPEPDPTFTFTVPLNLGPDCPNTWPADLSDMCRRRLNAVPVCLYNPDAEESPAVCKDWRRLSRPDREPDNAAAPAALPSLPARRAPARFKAALQQCDELGAPGPVVPGATEETEAGEAGAEARERCRYEVWQYWNGDATDPEYGTWAEWLEDAKVIETCELDAWERWQMDATEEWRDWLEDAGWQEIESCEYEEWKRWVEDAHSGLEDTDSGLEDAHSELE